MALRERDLVVLDIERGWWLDGRSKSEIVRARLHMSLSRYNQLLGQLVTNDEAEAYDPLVVRRLRRVQGAPAVGHDGCTSGQRPAG